MLFITSRIPEILKKLRLDCGFTQERVAKLLGIDRSTYSYYESGKINPDVKTILKLSKIYKVDYTVILDADAEMICSDSFDENFGKNQKPHMNEKEQEKNIMSGIKLLSRESRDEILEEILSRINMEKNDEKLKDWF